MKPDEHKAKKTLFFKAAALLLLSILLFSNTLKNDFVGYDDQNLIQQNTSIQSLSFSNIKHIFTPRLRGNYQPIRTLSYAIDYAFWGERPIGFHLTNIILNAASVILVWLLLSRLLSEEAAFVSATIFAILPIHVESVTWMSSRKDVLSLVFFLLSIILYDRSESRKAAAPYLWSLVAAGLAMLSKLTAVTIPACILLFEICKDGWPDARELRRKIIKLAPYFLLIAIIIWLNFLKPQSGVRHGDALVGLETTSQQVIKDIWLSMPLVVWRYIAMVFFPYHLSTHYEISRITAILDYRFLAPVAGLAGMLAVTLFLFMRGKRTVAFCIAWFFITFLPTSNIIPTAALLVDRYMYAPSIGVVALLGMVLVYSLKAAKLRPEKSAKRLAAVPAVALILFFSILTIRRNADWRTTYSLFSRTLAMNPKSIDARLALGTVFEQEGRLDAAIEMYRKGLETSPGNYRVLYNLGVAYMKKGWYPQAIHALEDSKAAKPNFLSTHYNLALVYYRLHRLDDAIAEYKAVLSLNPRHAASLGTLGRIYLERGDYELALEYLNQALRYQPDLVPALLDRVKLHKRQGHPERAAEDVKKLSSLGIETAGLRR